MRHFSAVNRAVKAASLRDDARNLPTICLCQTLAKQMDASGGDPSSRLAAAYLSALKDLRRLSLLQESSEEKSAPVSELDMWRSKHQAKG